MQIIHKHIQGIPPLKGNSFYVCSSCALAKINRCKLHHTSSHTKSQDHTEPDFLDIITPTLETDLKCGEHFHMDFGFVHGKYIQKDEIGKRITSIDGYNSYLLIIDRKSRYTWIMLSKTKQPPLLFLTQFFNHHGLTSGRRIVATDRGGELHDSLQFRELIIQANYLLQPTAPDAPFQNGLAE
jgi:hypothetical protein